MFENDCACRTYRQADKQAYVPFSRLPWRARGDQRRRRYDHRAEYSVQYFPIRNLLVHKEEFIPGKEEEY